MVKLCTCARKLYTFMPKLNNSFIHITLALSIYALSCRHDAEALHIYTKLYTYVPKLYTIMHKLYTHTPQLYTYIPKPYPYIPKL